MLKYKIGIKKDTFSLPTVISKQCEVWKSEMLDVRKGIDDWEGRIIKKSALQWKKRENIWILEFFNEIHNMRLLGKWNMRRID